MQSRRLFETHSNTALGGQPLLTFVEIELLIIRRWACSCATIWCGAAWRGGVIWFCGFVGWVFLENLGISKNQERASAEYPFFILEPRWGGSALGGVAF